MQVSKQHLELDMEKQTGSKLGKKYVKAVYCHPAYLTYAQSTTCNMHDEAQAGIKIVGRNINNFRYTYGRKQRRTKEPLDESERRKYKSWLKSQHSEN